jgi:hypothetical protein
MSRVAALILICFGLVSPACAKPLRTTGSEIFCLKARDLMDFAAAISSKKDANEAATPGCFKLKRGVRYTVLSEEPGRPDRIRIEWRDRGERGAAEGYMISLGE